MEGSGADTHKPGDHERKDATDARGRQWGGKTEEGDRGRMKREVGGRKSKGVLGRSRKEEAGKREAKGAGGRARRK